MRIAKKQMTFNCYYVFHQYEIQRHSINSKIPSTFEKLITNEIALNLNTNLERRSHFSMTVSPAYLLWRKPDFLAAHEQRHSGPSFI